MANRGVTTIYQQLSENISSTSKDASIPLNTSTFEAAELALPKSLDREQHLSLVTALANLLKELQQDPTPAVNLLLKLIDEFTYADILQFGPDALPYVDGLAVGEHMVGFNRLMLTILGKATSKAADAAHVAGMLDTMLALVRLWLCTSDTGVASQASKLLLDLLRVDLPSGGNGSVAPVVSGQGLVWKRMFGDRNVYGTFFEACSTTGPSSLDLSKNQRTLAQARVMEWLPSAGAMDWSTISRSHHADIEGTYHVTGGLLQFATIHMVDYKDDVLMYRCLIDFYSDLLRTTKPRRDTGITNEDSPALLYLIAEGLHTRTATIYLQSPGAQLDPLESMFLYGPAANYLATYASIYPNHFMLSQIPAQVKQRLMKALDLSPAKWAHAESPKHDLHLVASVPRQSLLPDATQNNSWDSSPLSLLPSKSTNADVLMTLATVFHGPSREAVTFPAGQSSAAANIADDSEGACARVLYFQYLSHNQHFWSDVVTHADTVALKDLALSAINCLTSVITANWSAQPQLTLPSNIAATDDGQVAILSPPALEYTLPYLLKPPKTYANLVGGRGDAESAAYKIAMAKFDALTALHRRLSAQVEKEPGEGYEDIVATIAKRLAQGPISREGEVGGHIGTLEL